MTRDNYYQDIRLALKKRIEQDWQYKWIHISDKPIYNYPFLEQLLNDIHSFQNNPSQKQSISIETLKRFINDESGKIAFRLSTIEAIATYLELPNYVIYSKEQQSLYKPIERVIEINADYKYFYVDKEKIIETEIIGFKKRIYKRVFYGLLGFSILVLFVPIYFGYDYFQEEKSKKQIKQAIEQGVKAEFNAYRSLPNVDTTNLSKYFTTNGNALKKIVYTIKRHKLSHKVISNENNPSSFQLYDYTFVELDREQGIASAKTMEHWYLRWFNDSTKTTDFIYNEMNNQYYHLRNENGHWKIDDNFYMSSTVNKDLK